MCQFLANEDDNGGPALLLLAHLRVPIARLCSPIANTHVFGVNLILRCESIIFFFLGVCVAARVCNSLYN